MRQAQKSNGYGSRRTGREAKGGGVAQGAEALLQLGEPETHEVAGPSRVALSADACSRERGWARRRLSPSSVSRSGGITFHYYAARGQQ